MALMVDEEKLRKILEEVYSRGWNHGLEGQVLMRPEVVFDPYIEECKKSP